MLENGSISTELGWTFLVLIPKGNTDTRGIGLLEVVWEVVEAVIDTRVKTVVQFHNFLHGFCAGRGAETAIIELKLAQGLASVYQDPLFLLRVDKRKAYDNLDHGQILQTLAGYRAGPKLWGLLVGFWSR